MGKAMHVDDGAGNIREISVASFQCCYELETVLELHHVIMHSE